MEKHTVIGLMCTNKALPFIKYVVNLIILFQTKINKFKRINQQQNTWCQRKFEQNDQK